MSIDKSPRRNFIRKTSLAMGSLGLIPFIEKNDEIEKDKRNTEKTLSIVCIGAHPGDPEFGCGGTMTKYAQAGHQVVLLYLTRGEAGDSSKTHAESAALRTKEAENACTILGTRPVFAGQIDGDTELNNTANEMMNKLIFSLNPDLVFSQWPVDAHRDHQVAGTLALNAWLHLNRKFQLYFYEVNTGSETMHFTPTDYEDISNVRELKKKAMFAHQTQSPEKTYLDYFKPLEEFRGLESGVAAAEAFIHFKDTRDRARIAGL